MRRYADGNIEAFIDEIDQPILERNIENDLRTATPEFGEEIRNPSPVEPAGATNPKGAARRGTEGAKLEFGSLQVLQDRLTTLEVHSAGLGQAEGAAVAVEEADPEALLCVHHVLADHRSREVEALGSRHEAARLDHLPEHLDAGQRVHLLSLRDVTMRAKWGYAGVPGTVQRLLRGSWARRSTWGRSTLILSAICRRGPIAHQALSTQFTKPRSSRP